MSATLESITRQAMTLAPEERTELIERLADSVLPAPPLHPAWRDELARRAAELDAGRVQAVPAHEVMARVRALIEQAEPSR
jgi:putative addiction module component (TIGR02574 family)